MAEFPPRGRVNGLAETAPRGLWSQSLDSHWRYDAQATPRSVLLGKSGNQFIGRSDDRHIVTIAGSRAGKSQTVLIPNLKRYRGTVVVVDPKGELAAKTARLRMSWGHKVVILNPFNVGGWGSNGHNPCAELLQSPAETVTADTAQLSDALIIDNQKDPHWTDSAKNLCTGLLLHSLTKSPKSLTMSALRSQLSASGSLPTIFEAMALNGALGGVISNIGLSYLGKYQRKRTGAEPSEEMRSILATANTQTRPLDDLGTVFSKHDFNLEELSCTEKPMTVYLVLPATRIPTHARWLRLFVTQMLATLERKPVPRDKLPVLLILEEFAALGHMRSIEAAAGYFAGFGVKLWTALQDLTQIKTHYKDSWETFLGNAGIIQAFGNVDLTTTKYLSELLGETTISEHQRGFTNAAQRAHGDDGIRTNLRSVSLLTPPEIRMHFARETNRQLVLVPGQLPVFLERLQIPEV